MSIAFKLQRRFFRTDTEVPLNLFHFHSDLENHINNHGNDFYADETNYITPFVLAKLDTFLQKAKQEQDAFLAQNPPNFVVTLLPLFRERLVLLTEAIKSFSQGKKYLTLESADSSILALIPLPEGTTKKVKRIFQALDAKLIHLANFLYRAEKKSTKTQFRVQGKLITQNFLADVFVAKLQHDVAQGRSVTPLVRNILALSDYLNYLIQWTKDICLGPTLMDSPQFWPVKSVNLSAGGIGFVLPYEVKISHQFFIGISICDCIEKGCKHLKHIYKVVRIEKRAEGFYYGCQALEMLSMDMDYIDNCLFKKDIKAAMHWVTQPNH